MAERANTTKRRRRSGGAGRPRHRARTLLVAAAFAVGAVGLAGCAAVRNELGTNASSCYVDLAVASHAVHHEGRLRGVRLVSVASLRLHAPLLYKAAAAPGKRTGQVCLVAFGGSFVASRVEDAIGKPVGHLAVVEFGFPDHELLSTLLVERPPLDFQHYHL